MFEWSIKEILQTILIAVSIVSGIIIWIKYVRLQQKDSDTQEKISAISNNEIKHLTEAIQDGKAERENMWTAINLLKTEIAKLNGAVEFIRGFLGKMNGGPK